ncbi:hypothetical protein [Marinobacterium arenosum]|uniref:hypothetical protein n=1 Tax=Marinobacterium arenosum TaxID=2862496 RepID=UPI001C98DA60|nr:hypothetical protein [Marinobacterium arenosum]MBY4676527.1 hypothetical protein [Marinobacterium arenosum]
MRKLAERFRHQPLLLPGVCLLLAVLFLAGGYLLSGWVDEQVERQYQMQQRRLSSAQQRLKISQRQVDIADEYLARFNAYRSKQLLGETDRLQWSDRLINLGQRLELKNLEFDFSGRRALEKEQARHFDVDQKIYNAFELKLDFQLQHEGDLFNMLNMIDRYISPMAILDYCKLQSLLGDQPTVELRDEGNLKAYCKLQVLEALPRQRDHG